MDIDELKAAWNAQADKYNQWDELGLDEILAFAQQQVLLEAAQIFEGARDFSWVCADGYKNGFDIGGELRSMAQKFSNV